MEGEPQGSQDGFRRVWERAGWESYPCQWFCYSRRGKRSAKTLPRPPTSRACRFLTVSGGARSSRRRVSVRSLMWPTSTDAAIDGS